MLLTRLLCRKPAPAAMAPKTGDRSLLVAACLLSSLQMEWLLFALSLVLTRESAREPFESSREFAERRFEPRGRCHRRPGDPLTLPRLWPCGPVSLSVNGRKGSKMAVEKRKLCCCCCSSKRLFSAICSLISSAIRLNISRVGSPRGACSAFVSRSAKRRSSARASLVREEIPLITLFDERFLAELYLRWCEHCGADSRDLLLGCPSEPLSSRLGSECSARSPARTDIRLPELVFACESRESRG
mmetsp:Transcript_22146/g.48288  ORF Transcript_22146/g.48288 Transcript_22146/m.48288 type:complete len:244 (+) Transcript_22146:280-1011(+)